MKTIKLFCLPYAGASVSIYYKWKKYLDPRIDLYCLEMPGRGMRFNEPLYNSIGEAVDAIYADIKNVITQQKCAFFGHSMGSMIAFELSYLMKDRQGIDPLHLFVSGRCPPHVVKGDGKLHTLPLDEFKQEIIKLGGTPEQIFEVKDMLDIFIPILRADYKIVETYKYIEKEALLSCNITALYGTEDDATSEKDMRGWGRYTSSYFNILGFNGGHFFIHDQTAGIVNAINKALL